MEEDSISVIIVDDHEMVRCGLRSMLTAPGIRVVGEASSGPEALEKIESLKPDVVLLDIRMPGLDGLATLEKINEGDHHPQVIMVTTYKSSNYLLRSLAIGAAGFILKDISRNNLLSVVQMVASGEHYVDKAFLKGVLTELNDEPRSQSEHMTDWVNPLSPRENEVLQLMVEGMTNQAIAYVLDVSPHTVKEHVQHVCQKLEANGRTDAVVKAIRLGLVE